MKDFFDDLRERCCAPVGELPKTPRAKDAPCDARAYVAECEAFVRATFASHPSAVSERRKALIALLMADEALYGVESHLAAREARKAARLAYESAEAITRRCDRIASEIAGENDGGDTLDGGFAGHH